VDTRAVVGRHETVLTEPWRESQKVDRIAQITKYVEEYKIEGKADDALAGVVRVELRKK
jgi:hypothetical protein